MREAEALSCQELVELVTAYLERALPSEDHARFEEHVAGCDGCERYVEQMQTTIRLTGKLTWEAVPPEAERALLSAFRSWAGS
jgi:predicted anti-sigma-YlaC factor YlaD